MQYRHKKSGFLATYNEGAQWYEGKFFIYPPAVIENSNDWEKINKPITQLKDENDKLIDIYIGDDYYYADAINNVIGHGKMFKTWYSLRFHYFATEKAAKDYLDTNSKKYSKAELIKAINETPEYCTDPDLTQFEAFRHTLYKLLELN